MSKARQRNSHVYESRVNEIAKKIKNEARINEDID
jgi:hypothetical protein